MVIPRRITNKDFAAKVLAFVLDELCYLREKFEHGDEQLIDRSDVQRYSPFYQCIGKAATLFAVMYKDKVKLTLYQNRRRFSQSVRNMDDFVNNFSASFFTRVESMPQPWFPVIVLTFCGVFGAIADICKTSHRSDLVDVCLVNLELDMRTLIDDIRDNGGWRYFYDTAYIFASLYDTKFWNDDSDQEQEPSHEPTEERAEESAQEPAQEVQEPVQAEQVQEPAQEAQPVQAVQVQEPQLAEAVQVQEPPQLAEAVQVQEPPQLAEAVQVQEPPQLAEAVQVQEPPQLAEAVQVQEPPQLAEAVQVQEPPQLAEAVQVQEPPQLAEAVQVQEPPQLAEAVQVQVQEPAQEAQQQAQES